MLSACSLISGSTLNIRLVFNSAPNGAVTATVNSGAKAATTVQLNDSTWQIEIPDIAANNLGTAYQVVVKVGDATVYDVSVSAMSYVDDVLKSNTGSDAENLALTALYNYFTAARDYQG